MSSRLDELGLDREQFAQLIDEPVQVVEGVMSGDQPITIDLAGRLATVLGASAEFWFTRECQYRETLDRLEGDEWASGLPFREMARAGWITDGARTIADRLREGLAFFGVHSLSEWKQAYRPALTTSLLRVSPRNQVVEVALAAWLHRASGLAQSQDVGTFSRVTLKQLVPLVRALTRKIDPERFIPELRTLLNGAGVALVVLPTIPGSPISGAARVLPDGSAMVAVSGRYLADDQLWFTVFHEIGHLLLHADQGLYLDDLSPEAASISDDEQEANRFAGQTLLPQELRDTIAAGRLVYRDVIRIARDAGISAGIVVGQLQYDERLGFNQLNNAKRRYEWDGSTLKSA
jgi:HTH-type transcriptional regulator/antitoxin HigA